MTNKDDKIYLTRKKRFERSMCKLCGCLTSALSQDKVYKLTRKEISKFRKDWNEYWDSLAHELFKSGFKKDK